MGLKLMSNRHPLIMSQTSYPLSHGTL